MALVAELCQRPLRGEGPAGEPIRGLPMLCLLWPEEDQSEAEPVRAELRGATPARAVPAARTSADSAGSQQASPSAGQYSELAKLGPLDKWLRERGEGAVPHHLITLDYQPASAEPGPLPAPQERDVELVRTLLHDCASGLTSGNAAQGRIRYPLSRLTNWLMTTSLPEDGEQDHALRELLRSRWWQQHSTLKSVFDVMAKEVPEPEPLSPAGAGKAGPLRSSPATRRHSAPNAGIISRVRNLPLYLQLLIWAIRLYTPSSPLPRWFLRQDYLTPGDPGGLINFALRLRRGEWQRQNLQQVCLFMVNAFLEDLRRSYRVRPGRRGPSWRGRRMAYPVLLLDGITRINGGYRLLELINDVRNQTGEFDPLLVISASHLVPPGAGRATASRVEESDLIPPVWPEAQAQEGYHDWCSVLRKNTRARKPTAWYLTIEMPSPATRLSPAGPVRVIGAPRWSAARNQFIFAVVMLMALAGAGWGVSRHVQDERCGVGWWHHGSSSLHWMGQECVGITDGSFQFTPDNTPHLARVEREVATLNAGAAAAHAQHPTWPYVTVVFLASLTAPAGNQALTAEREELEGVAAAQRRQLDEQHEPIVRVLIANGGTDMSHGPYVAAQLRHLAADPGIVAVVGLDESRRPTFQTIKDLAEAGLPTIAATLSADGLAGQRGDAPVSPLYFQIAPQNEREAQFVARYVAANYRRQKADSPRLRRQAEILYSSDKADIYSTNLASDAYTAFRHAGFPTVRKIQYTPGQVDGRSTCSLRGIVFFAGRAEDFANYLSQVDGCPQQPAWIISGDDAARFEAVHSGLYPQVPFDYVSFAIGPPSCASGAQDDLYSIMDKLFPFECGVNTYATLDGHAALTYDAAETVIHAVQYLRTASTPSVPVTPGTVWNALSHLHGQDWAYNGQSGLIDFGDTVSQHVPYHKAIAMMRAAGGAPKRQAYCGTSGALHLHQDPWCQDVQP